jgi:hypothetical protein
MRIVQEQYPLFDCLTVYRPLSERHVPSQAPTVRRACADRSCQESGTAQAIERRASRSDTGENRASGHPSVSPEEQTKSGTIAGDAIRERRETEHRAQIVVYKVNWEFRLRSG